jgi:hypothetical protein
VYDKRKETILIHSHIHIQFGQHHLLKRLSFLCNLFSALLCRWCLTKIIDSFLYSLFCSIDLCVCFYSMPCITHIHFSNHSLAVWIEVRYCNVSSLCFYLICFFFIFSGSLCYSGCFVVSNEFFSIAVNKIIRILMGTN